MKRRTLFGATSVPIVRHRWSPTFGRAPGERGAIQPAPRSGSTKLVLIRQLAFAALLLVGSGSVRAAAGYSREIAAARATRVDRLTQPWGWLTLVGSLPVPPGSSTIGRDPGNRLVLAAGPDHFGTITLQPDGRRVTFSPAGGADIQIDGNDEVESVELFPGSPARRPTLVSGGAVVFHLVESGGRFGVQVRDFARPELVDFRGLDYFSVDDSWRIEAQWVNGKAVFTREGTRLALSPLINPDGSLLFVFADATSEKETYAMRFLTVPRPQGDRILLDFNLAENPPCAFTPVAVCPLPPAGNRLSFAVRAGEKIFRRATH